MRATLTLRKAVWNQQAPINVLNEALDEAAVELESEFRKNIDESEATGRTYRLRTLTARRSTQNVGNRRRGTSTRVVIGAEFYRASSYGQPPAKRTGALYRALKVRRNGRMGIKASVNKLYARYLDSPRILNRPFFKSVATKYFKERFRPKVRAKIQSII
jgi:hypothetical protein